MRGAPKMYVPCESCPSLKGMPNTKRCHRCIARGSGQAAFTYAMDERIREVWSMHRDGQKGAFVRAIAALAVELNMPRLVLHYRAKRLGVTRNIRRFWTAAELRQLETMAGLCSAHTIAKRLGRSFASVACKMQELEIRATLLTGYSQDSLQVLIGKAPQTMGLMVAKGMFTADENGRIPHASVEAWLRRTKLEEVDFTRANQVWLRETLMNMLEAA